MPAIEITTNVRCTTRSACSRWPECSTCRWRKNSASGSGSRCRSLGERLADRPDRRPVGQRQETSPGGMFGGDLSSGVAGGSGGGRLLRRPADQARSRGCSRPSASVRPRLGQAVRRAERRRAVPLRFGPGMSVVRGPLSVAATATDPDNGSVAFDEFTSVVDRNVAKVVSAAVAKGIRGGPDRLPVRRRDLPLRRDRVACARLGDRHGHATFQRRWLRRPPIELEIFRCRRRAWRMFAKHHYLSGGLNRYGPLLPRPVRQAMPVAFCATLSLIGRKKRWRISGIVTLPDYQGIGIGMARGRGGRRTASLAGSNDSTSRPAIRR